MSSIVDSEFVNTLSYNYHVSLPIPCVATNCQLYPTKDTT